MNLVFEDLQNYRNLTACTDLIPANEEEPESFRFGTTNLVHLLQFNGVQIDLYSVEDRPDRYIFAVNGYVSPDFWACHQSESAQFTTSPFDHIPAPVLDDLRAGKALILFETLWEGFEYREIYGWWHREA